jgi:hypothetical protein
MPARHIPVRPDLDQLKNQAKELLRAIKNGDALAIEELRTHHPKPPEPATVKLANAQHFLARSYGIRSWPRLVFASRDGARHRTLQLGIDDETLHTYRDVTPLEWGRQFHDQSFVDKAAMQLIAARGGL